MIEQTAIFPSQLPVLALVTFCGRCQAKKKKKPGAERADLEKLNDALRCTEEGRADIYQVYQLLVPEVRQTMCMRGLH